MINVTLTFSLCEVIMRIFIIYISVTGTASINYYGISPAFIMEANAKCHLKCNEFVKIKM